MATVVSGADSGIFPGDRFGPQNAQAKAAACTQALDSAYQLLQTGHVQDGMELLMQRLSDIRRMSDAVEWDAIFQSQALNHPISRLIWQDPFTEHSYRRPRGYPGDAGLLDYIYGIRPAPTDTSSIGAEIFKFNGERQAPKSVRARADILAKMIDDVAEQHPSPRILSIACGHLREAQRSKAVAGGRIGEFLALDQDDESLAEVQRTYPGKGLHTIKQSVRAILAENVRFDDLDLVYAAGLYDYLSDRVASRLTRLMFDMLAPGGRLLIANFAPCLQDIGYMESFMGWKLIYREAEQMLACASEIGSSEWKSSRLFWDEHESIIFLEMNKRDARQRSLMMIPGLQGKAALTGMANVQVADNVAKLRSGTRHRSVHSNRRPGSEFRKS